MPATSLALEQTRDGTYVGTGANLAFDGRWQVTALIQRGADSVSVPLQLDVAGPAMQVLPRREASGKPYHVAIVPYVGLFSIDFDPEQAGPSTFTVSCHDRVFEARPIDSIVVTHEAPRCACPAVVSSSHQSIPVRIRHHLSPGVNRIVAVTHGADGSGTRTVFDITIEK